MLALGTGGPGEQAKLSVAEVGHEAQEDTAGSAASEMEEVRQMIAKFQRIIVYLALLPPRTSPPHTLWVV